jgi:hypothetical protein
MGVLPCQRNGCKNIMCDRYSYRYGYICNECFEELSKDCFTNIEDFMEIPKGTPTQDTERWLGFINEEFIVR